MTNKNSKKGGPVLAKPGKSSKKRTTSISSANTPTTAATATALGTVPKENIAGLTSAAVSAAEVNAMAIAASLGLPIIDPVKKDIPDNLKSIIKDLMEISSGIVSDNKTTKMAAVAAMKKKFGELGLFSWLDIADDGTMRSKPGMSINSAKEQIAASLGANTHLPFNPDLLPRTIQAIASSIDLKGLEAEWYVDDDGDEGVDADDSGEYIEYLDSNIGSGAAVEADEEYSPDPELSTVKCAIITKDSSNTGAKVKCSCSINHLLDDFGDGTEVDSDLEYLFDSTSGNDLNHIDPVKLQVVQTAEHELSSVYALFESKQLSDEDKWALLKRKYMELMQKDIQGKLEGLRTRETVQALEAERDVARKELEKMNALKQKLESLYADLQEENRKIRAEALKRLDHSSTSYNGANTNAVPNKCRLKNGCSRCGCTLDTSTSFPALPDLPEAVSLQKAGARTLAEQLHKFVDIYRLRERHFRALSREKEAEVDVQLAKTLTAELANDTLKQRLDAYEKQISALRCAEGELKTQLSMYVDKFKQVEETLGKSNDLFATFRREMEQMTAKLSRLEGENHQLQSKCNTLSRNIIEMADERTKQNASYEALRAQKSKLEQLCRTLQAERKAVMNAATSSQSQ